MMNVGKSEGKEAIQYELNKDFDIVAVSSLEPKRSRLRNDQGAVGIYT